MLIDDGSTDGTVERAKAFCQHARRRAHRDPAAEADRQDADNQASGARARFRRRVHSGRGHRARVRQLHRADGPGAVSGGRHRQRLRHDPPAAPQRSAARSERCPEVRAFDANHPSAARRSATGAFRTCDAASRISIARRSICFFSASSIAGSSRFSARPAIRSAARSRIGANTCRRCSTTSARFSATI